MSHPPLPSTCDHPLWQNWDLAVETCLSQLMRDGILGLSKSRPILRQPVEKEQEEGDTAAEQAKKLNNLNKSNLTSAVPATQGGVSRTKNDGVLLGNNNTNNSNKVAGPNVQARRSQSNPTSGSSTTVSSYNITAPFFSEQLTAFEIWLDYACNRIKEGGIILNPPRNHDTKVGMFDIDAPEQLPVVLQVLLSPAHRVRALLLLRRFLSLGPSAVNLALSVGIFPYVLRLLQSQIDEYKHVLVGIWNKILEFDPSCQIDLVKDGAISHFVRHLHWGCLQYSRNLKDISPDRKGKKNSSYPTNSGTGKTDDSGLQRTMAAVILSAICSEYSTGKTECLNRNLHGTCCEILQSIDVLDSIENNNVPSQLRQWLCITLGVMFKDIPTGREKAFQSNVHLRLFSRTTDDSPDVRAAACFALGSLIGPSDRSTKKIEKDDMRNNRITGGFTSMLNLSDKWMPEKANQTDQNNLKNSDMLPQILLPGTTTGFSPMGNMWQKQQLDSSSPHLQPMQQYSNMAYGPSQTQSGTLFPQSHSNQTGLPSHSVSSPSLQKLSFQEHNINSSTSGSVFQNRIPLERDLSIVEKMIQLSDDASPTVRYEAIIVLGKVVDRYLMGFVAIPHNLAPGKDNDNDLGLTMPKEVDINTQSLFTRTWKRIRFLHDHDTHPSVSRAATAILRFVNEHILVLETSFRRIQERRSYSERRSNLFGLNPPDGNETFLEPNKQYKRINSERDMGKGERKQSLKKNYAKSPSSRLSSLKEASEDESDRSASPQVNHLSLIQNGVREDSFGSDGIDGHINIDMMNILPISKFYDWKKSDFEKQGNGECLFNRPDPLSADGAICLYREQRNLQEDTNCATLSDFFTILLPKRSKRRTNTHLLDLDDKSVDEEFEAEMSSKKKALHLEEKSLLTNHNKKGTYMLRFHSYEAILASSDGSDCVTIWDMKRSDKASLIHNCNPSETRMTSMCWINERNNSLLLTGCEDGSIRIWDNVISTNALNHAEPSLSTAFFAMPELVPNKRGSGLVTEWQQSNGRLVTGGNTNLIRCWDLQSEKCRMKIETDNMTSCLTTFATAWDYVHNSETSEGYSGIGPDILLGGYGDGIIKVFDLRAHQQQKPAQIESKKTSRQKKGKELSEHTHWIVNVCYNHCGNNYEVSSGSILGDVKFWDLRMFRSSLRTIKIQSPPMTALTSHSRIPLLASGSHANFIKIFTPDGDVLQVIRNHKKSGRKIGPVSVVTFHPNIPLFAAGATDEIISIYGTNGNKHVK